MKLFLDFHKSFTKNKLVHSFGIHVNSFYRFMTEVPEMLLSNRGSSEQHIAIKGKFASPGTLPRRLKGRTRTATLILQLSAGFGGILLIIIFFLGSLNQSISLFFTKNFALFFLWFFHLWICSVSNKNFALISMDSNKSTLNLTLFNISSIIMPLQMLFFHFFTFLLPLFFSHEPSYTTCVFRFRFTSESPWKVYKATLRKSSTLEGERGGKLERNVVINGRFSMHGRSFKIF